MPTVVAVGVHWASGLTTAAAMIAVAGAVTVGLLTLRASRRQAAVDAKRAAYADALVALFAAIELPRSPKMLAERQESTRWRDATWRARATIMLLGESATLDQWRAFGQEWSALAMRYEERDEHGNPALLSTAEAEVFVVSLRMRADALAAAMKAELDG